MTQPANGSEVISSELYFELQNFYARQTQALDGGDGAGFAATFTDDGTFTHLPRGEVVNGREQIATDTQRNLDKLAEAKICRRHWFNMLVGDVDADGTIRTSFTAIVTRTDPSGTVFIEPTCEVEDIVVRRDDELRNRSRIVRTDTPKPV